MKRSLLLAALALAACAGSTSNVQQGVVNAEILASGVQGTYSSLKIFYPGMTNTATDAQINAIFARLPIELAELKAATTPIDQAGDLRSIERDVNAVVNLAAGVITSIPGCGPVVVLIPCPVPDAVVKGFQAAAVLLPIIEATANQLVPATVGAPGVPRVFVSRMRADEARVVLVGAKR